MRWGQVIVKLTEVEHGTEEHFAGSALQNLRLHTLSIATPSLCRLLLWIVKVVKASGRLT